jgi:NAD(P)-dependent dehydrogenase (short-subunit alcohol dehydrogenase family)
MAKTWFITGASRGFGREFTLAALERGDAVAATARNVGALRDLVDRYGGSLEPIALDVTDRDAVHAAVARAIERFGQLDVVVNNAGFGVFGAVEEVSEFEMRALMETNFFGALWVTQAVLPSMREAGRGHIVQISSIGGVVASTGLGAYNASKHALEGISDALAQEVAPFGVKVTLVEPGAFGTDWSGESALHSASMDAYVPLRESLMARRDNAAYGSAAAAARSLLRIVDSPDPPRRVLFGAVAYDLAISAYQERVATWAEWERTSREADG